MRTTRRDEIMYYFSMREHIFEKLADLNMRMEYTRCERARVSELQMRITELELEVRKLNRYNKQFYLLNKNMENNNQANMTNHFEGANIGKIVYNYGTINENNYGQNTATPLAQTDKDIKAAIEELLKSRDGEGNPVFKNKKQWWAVFRVLSTFCNYPSKMSDFVTKMNDLQVEGAEGPFLVSYESLRKAAENVPLMACSPAAWDAQKERGENYRQQYNVAEFLMLKLGIKS